MPSILISPTKVDCFALQSQNVPNCEKYLICKTEPVQCGAATAAVGARFALQLHCCGVLQIGK